MRMRPIEVIGRARMGTPGGDTWSVVNRRMLDQASPSGDAGNELLELDPDERHGRLIELVEQASGIDHIAGAMRWDTNDTGAWINGGAATIAWAIAALCE